MDIYACKATRILFLNNKKGFYILINDTQNSNKNDCRKNSNEQYK